MSLRVFIVMVTREVDIRRPFRRRCELDRCCCCLMRASIVAMFCCMIWRIVANSAAAAAMCFDVIVDTDSAQDIATASLLSEVSKVARQQ